VPECLWEIIDARWLAITTPLLTRPVPFSIPTVGRKKIRIERIADERNRQVSAAPMLDICPAIYSNAQQAPSRARLEKGFGVATRVGADVSRVFIWVVVCR
jgi:hypothetical protein